MTQLFHQDVMLSAGSLLVLASFAVIGGNYLVDRLLQAWSWRHILRDW
jgi:hypothetical protein